VVHPVNRHLELIPLSLQPFHLGLKLGLVGQRPLVAAQKAHVGHGLEMFERSGIIPVSAESVAENGGALGQLEVLLSRTLNVVAGGHVLVVALVHDAHCRPELADEAKALEGVRTGCSKVLL
jgi:hypothetical protein